MRITFQTFKTAGPQSFIEFPYYYSCVAPRMSVIKDDAFATARTVTLEQVA
jgi:hypothetical protein